jgi:hypothetical protein
MVSLLVQRRSKPYGPSAKKEASIQESGNLVKKAKDAMGSRRTKPDQVPVSEKILGIHGHPM